MDKALLILIITLVSLFMFSLGHFMGSYNGRHIADLETEENYEWFKTELENCQFTLAACKYNEDINFSEDPDDYEVLSLFWK